MNNYVLCSLVARMVILQLLAPTVPEKIIVAASTREQKMLYGWMAETQAAESGTIALKISSRTARVAPP